MRMNDVTMFFEENGFALDEKHKLKDGVPYCKNLFSLNKYNLFLIAYCKETNIFGNECIFVEFFLSLKGPAKRYEFILLQSSFIKDTSFVEETISNADSIKSLIAECCRDNSSAVFSISVNRDAYIRCVFCSNTLVLFESISRIKTETGIVEPRLFNTIEYIQNHIDSCPEKVEKLFTSREISKKTIPMNK